MARPYTADNAKAMRLMALLLVGVVFAAPAAASPPRFGLFDLHDLARPSHNAFGDVKLSKRPALLRGIVVHCGPGCRFGAGWLAFEKGPSLSAGDVTSAKAHVGRVGWSVHLGLTRRGHARWTAFAQAADRHAKSNGVPDVLVVVVDGAILALPYASDVRHDRGTLVLDGFSRAGALRAAKTLR
jgi:hypothetical protein